MTKDKNESINFQNNYTSQDEIMNKVNQTFDKMEQEVKELIHKNDQESNLK